MKQRPGYCDHCPTVYGVGPGGFRQFGDRCGDLSLQPESCWPEGCPGTIRPLREIPASHRRRLRTMGILTEAS